MNAVILAAGLGTRLKPLTEKTPKPLLPLMNRPIIGTIIDKLTRNGCARIGVNVYYQHGFVVDFLSRYYSSLIEVSLEDELAGTGGAFLGFKGMLDNVVLVHNCDVVSEIDINELCSVHMSKKPLASIALTRNAATDIVTVDGDRVKQFNKTVSSNNYTYTGIAVLSPRIKDYFPSGQRCFSLVDHVFKNALANDEYILGHAVRGKWIDIGTPGSYWTAHKFLAEKTMMVPEIRCKNPVCIHKTSSVKTRNIKGFLIVGPNSSIERKVTMENTVVFAGSRITAGIYRDCLLSNDFCMQDLGHEGIDSR
jgi:NDP-sugar pyrophosphorylase family protein